MGRSRVDKEIFAVEIKMGSIWKIILMNLTEMKSVRSYLE